MSKYIVDLSHHQPSSQINYSVFCAQLELAIIRVQYGSKQIDREYKNHIAKMKQYNVDYGVYAWTRGRNIAEMQNEARLFYQRAKDQDPDFYVLDVEEKTMSDMRSGIEKYIEQLRVLTDKPIGIYVANHLYKDFNLDVSDADFVWIPKYSSVKPTFDCDVWQYTSSGYLNGYAGKLDLNRLVNGATMDIFNSKSDFVAEIKTYPIPIKTIKITDPLTHGDDVKWIQSKLGFNGKDLDGYYGKVTEKAVKEFQQKNKLLVDGVVGKKTIAKLMKVV
jgi:GH25 family lysozyme M1 (1,4-beta-N-acetylmuramidase)